MCTTAPQIYHSLPIEVLEDDLLFPIWSFLPWLVWCIHDFLFMFWCCFSILWPKKVFFFVVVFLIYFTCHFSTSRCFCCDTVVKQQKKKPEELYTAKLTHKPTEHSLRRCLNWKTISHTALPLATSFSDISHLKMISLTVPASRFFWFRWSKCHRKKQTVLTLNLTAAAAVCCVDYV